MTTKTSNLYCGCSIDPGTRTLGFCAWAFDLETFNVEVYHVETLNVLGYEESNFEYNEVLPNPLIVRLRGLQLVLTKMFEDYSPKIVTFEDAFYKRLTGARSYERLIRCQEVIMNALAAYDKTCPVEIILPSVAKLTLGIPGNTKDKLLVPKTLETIDWIKLPDGITYDDLDEHSCDSIMLMHAFLKEFRRIWMLRCQIRSDILAAKKYLKGNTDDS